MCSLRATYNHMIAKLSGRELGKDALRSRLSFLEGIEGSFVGAVALGLIGESANTLVQSSWYSVLDAYRAPAALIGAIGGYVVTAGVFGEFVMHWVYARASGRLDRILDLETANLNERAAEANARAAGAHRIAEEERLKRVELENRRAPRRLTPAQFNQVVSRLSPFAPMGAGILVPNTGSLEPWGFAADLEAALGAAGWDVAMVLRTDPALSQGVLIEISPDADERAKSVAPEILATFLAAGIDVIRRMRTAEGGTFAGDEERKRKATGAPILINVGEHPAKSRPS